MKNEKGQKNMNEYYDYNRQDVSFEVMNDEFNSLEERQLGTPTDFFGGQFQQPFGPPQGSQSGPPLGPPPAYEPQASQVIGVQAVDPGAIRRCLYRYTYIRLTNGRRFWAWLVFAGRRSVAGWRWNGFRWVYFGTDLRNISSFECF